MQITVREEAATRLTRLEKENLSRTLDAGSFFCVSTGQHERGRVLATGGRETKNACLNQPGKRITRW